jgi:hypothetical protein
MMMMVKKATLILTLAWLVDHGGCRTLPVPPPPPLPVPH